MLEFRSSIENGSDELKISRAVLSSTEMASAIALYQRRGGVAANTDDVSCFLVELQVAIPFGSVVYDIMEQTVSTAFDGGQQISLVLPVHKVVELLERLKFIYKQQEAEDEHRGSISVAASNLLQHRAMRHVTADQILMNATTMTEPGSSSSSNSGAVVEDPLYSLKAAFMKKMSRAGGSTFSSPLAPPVDSASKRDEATIEADSQGQRESLLASGGGGGGGGGSGGVSFAALPQSFLEEESGNAGSSSLSSSVSINAETVMTTLGAVWYHHAHEDDFDDSFDAFGHLHGMASGGGSNTHHPTASSSTVMQRSATDRQPPHEHDGHRRGVHCNSSFTAALAHDCGYPSNWDWENCLLIHMEDLLVQVPAVAKEIAIQAVNRRLECLSNPAIRPHVPAVLLDRALLTVPDFAYIASVSGLVFAEVNRAVLRVQAVCRLLKRESSAGVVAATATAQAVAAHMDTTSGTRLGLALKRAMEEADQAKAARDKQLKVQFGNVADLQRRGGSPLRVAKPVSSGTSSHQRKPPTTPRSAPSNSASPRTRPNQTESSKSSAMPSSARAKSAKTTAVASPSPQPVVVPSRPNTARTSRVPAPRRDADQTQIPFVRPVSSALSSFFEDASAAAAMCHAINDLEAAHLKMVAHWTHSGSRGSVTTPASSGLSPRLGGGVASSTPPAVAPGARRPTSATTTRKSSVVTSPAVAGTLYSVPRAAQEGVEEVRRSDMDNDEEIDMTLAADVEATSSVAALRARRFEAGRRILRFLLRVKMVRLRELFIRLGLRHGLLLQHTPIVQASIRAKVSKLLVETKFQHLITRSSHVLQRVARGFAVRCTLRSLHRPRWIAFWKTTRTIQSAGRGFLARRRLFAALEDQWESQFLDNIIMHHTQATTVLPSPPPTGGLTRSSSALEPLHNPLETAVTSQSQTSSRVLSRRSSGYRDFLDEDANLDNILEQLAPDRHLLRKLSGTSTGTSSTPRASICTGEFVVLQKMEGTVDDDSSTGNDFQNIAPTFASIDTSAQSQSQSANGPGRLPADALDDREVLEEVVATVGMDYDMFGGGGGSNSQSNSTSMNASAHRNKWLEQAETMSTLAEELRNLQKEYDFPTVGEGEGGDDREENAEASSRSPRDFDDELWNMKSDQSVDTGSGALSSATMAPEHEVEVSPTKLETTRAKKSSVTFPMEHEGSQQQMQPSVASFVKRKASLTIIFQTSLILQIQATARGFIARKRLGRAYHQNRRMNAMRMLRRVCRGYRARIKFGLLHSSMVDSAAEMLLWERRDEAAKVIQLGMRRMFARLRLLQLQQDVANDIRFRVELER